MSDSSEESNADIISLVKSVYCDVWDEFYVWEQAHSESVINSLRRNDMDLLKGTTIEPQGANIPNSSSNWEFPDSREPSIIKAPRLEPTPSYESCAPMSRNYFVGDDPDDLHFLPFPNDSKFDLVGYQSHYRSFEWQHRTLNPDLETIILETVTRLNSYHEISLEDIQKTRVFPEVSMWKLGERDFLQWLVFPVLHKNIPKSTLTQEQTSIQARFEREVSAFCPSLNCTEHFCCSHENDSKIGPPNPSSDIQELQEARKPCGTACYYISSTEEHFDSSEIDNMDYNSDLMATLTTILSVCPNLDACHLATACRRTCKEVFSAMRKLQERKPPFDEGDIFKNSIKSVGPIEILEQFTLSYAPGDPCHHEGPCDSTVRCPCYTNKAYCEKGCRCSPMCRRRYRGCRCKVRNKLKAPATCRSTDKCPCVMAGRECDPEVCGPCKPTVKQADGDSLCWNSQIQRGKQKGTAVMGTRHGQGLFVTEKVNEGDFIAEYVGEIILEPTVESRDFVNVHRGRNYLFALNSVLSVDASTIGNESRFINHAKGKKANCGALCRLVNGEHRIGIFATKNLKEGTELLLDYGRSFFVN